MLKRTLRLCIPFVCCLLLHAVASAQLPNEGFEEWGQLPGKTEQPVGWALYPVGGSKVEEGHSGKFALSVWNWYISSLGYAVAGERMPYTAFDLKHVGIPISFVPTRLTGYYRYELGENRFSGEPRVDSAAVYVLVKRYNPELGDVDTISFVPHLLPPSDGWIPFSIDLPVRLPGAQPDSIVVAFFSSNPERPAACGPQTGDCCYFFIDDVSLEAPSGVYYDLNSLPAPVRVVPNPVVNAAASFQFDGEEGKSYRARIYNAEGGLAAERVVVGPSADLSGLGLPAGAYHIAISDLSGSPVAAGRFVVE